MPINRGNEIVKVTFVVLYACSKKHLFRHKNIAVWLQKKLIKHFELLLLAVYLSTVPAKKNNANRYFRRLYSKPFINIIFLVYEIWIAIKRGNYRLVGI